MRPRATVTARNRESRAARLASLFLGHRRRASGAPSPRRRTSPRSRRTRGGCGSLPGIGRLHRVVSRGAPPRSSRASIALLDHDLGVVARGLPQRGKQCAAVLRRPWLIPTEEPRFDRLHEDRQAEARLRQTLAPGPRGPVRARGLAHRRVQGTHRAAPPLANRRFESPPCPSGARSRGRPAPTYGTLGELEQPLERAVLSALVRARSERSRRVACRIAAGRIRHQRSAFTRNARGRFTGSPRISPLRGGKSVGDPRRHLPSGSTAIRRDVVARRIERLQDRGRGSDRDLVLDRTTSEQAARRGASPSTSSLHARASIVPWAPGPHVFHRTPA